MELLTQHLPSGFNYNFPSLHIQPMHFGMILEYLDNVPKDDVEKFYFDYCTLKQDDPNVDQLLLPDLEYCMFIKKVVTLSKSNVLTSTIECPVCHSLLQRNIRIPEDIKFNRIEEKLLKGVTVEIGGRLHAIKLPTMSEFMVVFNNYRRLKKVTDMKLIKLIALFKDAVHLPNFYENLVVKATYGDISMLTMLSQMYYEIVDPVVFYCPECNKDVTSNDEKRGITIGIHSLVVDFFRDLIINNQVDESKILFGEIPKYEERGESIVRSDGNII